jgi:hypothetical protein
MAWSPAAALVLAASLSIVLAKPHGEDVHRPDADCGQCHTGERNALGEDAAGARALVVPDLEQRCLVCHGDEGPSHRTGMPPNKPVPDTLPLSSTGLITCATCHFMHGEKNPFGDFVRLDNSHGGLCLTCHQLSELE